MHEKITQVTEVEVQLEDNFFSSKELEVGMQTRACSHNKETTEATIQTKPVKMTHCSIFLIKHKPSAKIALTEDVAKIG